jgi:hypothetical protein
MTGVPAGSQGAERRRKGTLVPLDAIPPALRAGSLEPVSLNGRKVIHLAVGAVGQRRALCGHPLHRAAIYPRPDYVTATEHYCAVCFQRYEARLSSLGLARDPERPDEPYHTHRPGGRIKA